MSPLVSVPARSCLPLGVLFAALACAWIGTVSIARAAPPADPDPGETVTLADVEKALGGKFSSRSPEPGVIFYEEVGGPRQVNVYLWPADGRSLADLKPNLVSNGEPIEEISGLGDGAIFRPQGREVLVELTSKAGPILWLTVSVQNVDNPTEVRRLGLELAQRGVGRL